MNDRGGSGVPPTAVSAYAGEYSPVEKVAKLTCERKDERILIAESIGTTLSRRHWSTAV